MTKVVPNQELYDYLSLRTLKDEKGSFSETENNVNHSRPGQVLKLWIKQFTFKMPTTQQSTQAKTSFQPFQLILSSTLDPGPYLNLEIRMN